VRANFDSGILKLKLDQRAEAKPKQIKIGVNNGRNNGTPESRTVEAPKSAA
jgi:hypothetical protein